MRRLRIRACDRLSFCLVLAAMIAGGAKAGVAATPTWLHPADEGRSWESISPRVAGGDLDHGLDLGGALPTWDYPASTPGRPLATNDWLREHAWGSNNPVDGGPRLCSTNANNHELLHGVPIARSSGSSPWLAALSPSEQPARCRDAVAAALGEFVVEASCDYRRFYSRRGLVLQGCGLGMAAILANTPLDEGFQDWHDTAVKGRTSDDLAVAVKWLGEGRIAIPVCVGAALLSLSALPDDEPIGVVGQWGIRSLRGFAVGSPSLLAIQYLYCPNASRPEDGLGSRWRPFNDPYGSAAASGHSFIGAVPLLTAARMTDNGFLKTGFYALSTLPAWSRVNDRMHYLSQALLGWWLAWLAVEAVHETELAREDFAVLPLVASNTVGMHAVWRW